MVAEEVARMRTWELHIPGQIVLNANQRDHWQARARKVKVLRHASAVMARNARIPALAHITVGLQYIPTRKGRRDADNLVPNLKALCDGLVDAGIVPDDTPEWMTKLMPTIGLPDRASLHRFVLVVTEGAA
jgi:crossover junction endodeoxyribonuclease RusA